MLFEPGSFGSTKGGGLAVKASKALMRPETDRLHFFMIFLYVPEFNDYIIIESINVGLFAKGITFGWLSKYKGEDVEIYSISDPEIAAYGEYACYSLMEFGAAPYDFLLIPMLALSGVWAFLKNLLTERRVRRLRPEELYFCRNRKFICTEVPQEGWLSLSYWIVPDGVTAIPAGYRQAEIENRIQRNYKGGLHDILG
ncbi:MAG: hypothetical protein E3J66_00300 [Dehalococcoidia bacterium]|nr:MAG: hypothetical protein E3J66_00300 [Dehalococcoidia bacterium]